MGRHGVIWRLRCSRTIFKKVRNKSGNNYSWRIRLGGHDTDRDIRKYGIPCVHDIVIVIFDLIKHISEIGAESPAAQRKV